MEERIYARLNLWDNQLLDYLKLGIAFHKINQIGSPKDVKLDQNAKDPIAKARSEIKRTIQLLYCNPSPKDVKLDQNAKDPIAKARSEIKRTIQLLYCNPAYVKQSGFTQEELLAAPDTALLCGSLMASQMVEELWNNLCQDVPPLSINFNLYTISL